jgi:predicted double-glycine peptidase
MGLKEARTEFEIREPRFALFITIYSIDSKHRASPTPKEGDFQKRQHKTAWQRWVLKSTAKWQKSCRARAEKSEFGHILMIPAD